MLFIYQVVIGILFYCSLPFSLLFVWITGKHRKGLLQRFAIYPEMGEVPKKNTTVWLHAASVGEVQAAKAIIPEIRKELGDITIILTTMTLTGKRVAERQIEPRVRCYLAPLDIPGIVELAIARIRPDIYICIETELWPVLITALSRRKIFVGMLNGRISSRSYHKYKRLGSFISQVIHQFDRMAVISDKDRDKYLSLGALSDSIIVEGNVKYDISAREDAEMVLHNFRNFLSLTSEKVFIAGSTHNNEEQQLLGLYKNWSLAAEILFIIVPRHIERLESLENLMGENIIDYHLFSNLKAGTQLRKHSMILVDTMGDLADLYGVADYIFCGGSLVNKGGHNLMEAAIWDKAVFYGHSIDDFHDAADLLESVEGGFRVDDVADLERKILYYRTHQQEYNDACNRAGKIARAQLGSSSRQIKYILDGFL